MIAAAEDNLTDRLASMGQDQLKELVSRANFLLDPSGTGKLNSSDVQMVGWEFTCALAEATGVKKTIPLSVLLGTKAGSHFNRGVKILMEYVRENFGTSQRVEEVKVVRFLMRLAIRDLRDRKTARGSVPLGPMTLARQLVWIAAVVDRHFPGYAQANLLPILLHRSAENK